jgi:hypothetical protein
MLPFGCGKGVLFLMDPQLDPRVLRGKQLIEQLWWTLAKRILRTAGDLYKWDDDQWRQATELFLRPNDYKVIAYIE